MEERRLGPVVELGTWNTFGTDARLAHTVVDAALLEWEQHAAAGKSPWLDAEQRRLVERLAA